MRYGAQRAFISQGIVPNRSLNPGRYGSIPNRYMALRASNRGASTRTIVAGLKAGGHTVRPGARVNFADRKMISNMRKVELRQHRATQKSLTKISGATKGAMLKNFAGRASFTVRRGGGSFGNSLRAAGFGALVGTGTGVVGLGAIALTTKATQKVKQRKMKRAKRPTRKNNVKTKSQLNNGKNQKKPSFARRHIRVRRDGKGRFAGSY